MKQGFWKRNFLLVIVFITGAAVLVIEVVATRVLAPYFGNTIFSFSSIISTILAALSFGYFFGGKLADRKPSINIFFIIIFIGGICTLLIQWLSVALLPIFSNMFSIISGPLISAVVLFFIPSFFLGMLSPFAIKLQQTRNPETGIGSISGKIFFWSTFGSIFGSLFSGFYLIPNFGLSSILVATGLGLVLMSGIFLIVLNKNYRKLLGLTILVIFLSAFQLPVHDVEAIYNKDGIYQRVTVRQGLYNEGKELILLSLDTSRAGWKYVDPENGMVDYAKYYKLIELLDSPQKILVIGGGAYLVPDLIIDETDDVEVNVVEIEPSLYDVAVKYFDLTENERLKNYITDGRRFLKDSEIKYDLIFADAYASLFSIPPHLITEEFFELGKSKLNDSGIFWANIIGSIDSMAAASEVKTFRKVFPNSYFFATEDAADSEVQNIMFVGVNSDMPIDFTNESIIEKFQPLIPNIGKMIIPNDRFSDEGILLTDNYSPIDYLINEYFRK